ncbi:MAG TPA: aquaporin [Gemmatimonadales bacterium]|nr:aquaporin [Gemmatimonadales bacterium]
MSHLTRALTAEFLGTFALVFIGAGAVVTDNASGGQLGLIGVALAHALVLSVMVTAAMRISGAHFNPAVTVAIWLSRRIAGRDAVLYLVTQLAAAVAAALLVKALFPVGAGLATAYGVPRVAGDVSFLQATVIEAILTFMLVSAVFGTAVSPEAPAVGGFGIGLVLVFAILAGGPLTGAALNPGRAFGPAVAANDWHAQLVFWAGPLLGAAVASLLWSQVLLPAERR